MIVMDEDRRLLREYVLSFLGVRYTFGTVAGGGDDPLSGFDCSGFASEILRAAGVVTYNYRDTAAGIHANLTRLGAMSVQDTEGAFSFYGQTWKEISHVGWCLSSYLMIEAGGGDSSTVTESESSRRNAFVRIRPIHYRRDYLGCLLLKEWAV